MLEQTRSAKSRYTSLDATRQPVLDRGREASKLTIPSLLPPENHSQAQSLDTPYQGIGAMGVNNLAAKLLLTTFPPNSPLFKLTVDDFTLQKMDAEKARAEFEDAFQTIERTVMDKMEAKQLRSALFLVKKHLIVAGNVLLHVPQKGSIRVFKLDQYVVKRDPTGNILEIIVKEKLTKSALDEDLKSLLEDSNKGETSVAEEQSTVDLYTYIYREGDKFKIFQELNGKVVPDSDGEYPEDKLPWLALRWTRIDGEDYGRGHVEEYYGDLKSAEELSKAIVSMSAIAAKVVILVKPGSTTKKDTISKAKSGDIVTGQKEDIDTLQIDKFSDFQVTERTLAKITERLSMAFLLNTAVQRDAERVTAQEIRYMAGLLEDTLGGLYSLLGQELQLPLVRIVMGQMEAEGDLPKLPDDQIKPVIVTGMEALGRGQDLQKLNMLLQGIQSLGEQGQSYLNAPEWLKRFGASLSIDMDGLIFSEEEVQQQQLQGMIQQIAQNPQLVQQLQGAIQQPTPQQGV